MTIDYTHWFIRARLKTRQLMLLVALGDEGNIHRAAKVLHMTQPAASKLLKDLEDVLGVALFDRLPRGMRPTLYGDTMIRHARAALTSLNQAHDDVMGLKAGRLGQVNVGAITSPGLVLLPRAVALVRLEQPGLRMAVDIDTSDLLLERLAQGKLDILVARLFERHDKQHLRYQRLSSERVSAVGRPGHPLLGGAALSLADVNGAEWIVPAAGSVLRHRFELTFQQAGLAAPHRLVESTALLFVTRMLQQSDMLAVMAADVAQYWAAHGVVSLLPLELPCHMDHFGLITRTDRMLSPAAEVVLAALQRCGGEVYGTGTD